MKKRYKKENEKENEKNNNLPLKGKTSIFYVDRFVKNSRFNKKI